MIARSSKWQLQEAKNKLSEVIRRAREEGPQTITVRGKETVIVVSSEAYRAWEKLGRKGESITEFLGRWDGPGSARPVKPPENLHEFMQRSPAAGLSLADEDTSEAGDSQ